MLQPGVHPPRRPNELGGLLFRSGGVSAVMVRSVSCGICVVGGPKPARAGRCCSCWPVPSSIRRSGSVSASGKPMASIARGPTAGVGVPGTGRALPHPPRGLPARATWFRIPRSSRDDPASGIDAGSSYASRPQTFSALASALASSTPWTSTERAQ
jgi:hypothetical protein